MTSDAFVYADSDGWKRVAKRVAQERAAHEWSQDELAEFSGLSVKTIQHLGRADRQRLQRTSAVKICDVFAWTPNSIDLIAAGEDAVYVDEGAGGRARKRQVRASSVADFAYAMNEPVLEILAEIRDLLRDQRRNQPSRD